MNTKLIKSAFLEIKSRKKIFISILFMAFLGVGFFSGIKATAPSMKNTIESYFNDNNTFDIEIMSSNMINNTLIENIKEIDGINDIEPVISVDKISLYNDKKPVVKIFSLPNKINKLKLVEGRLPINDDECVIDAAIKKSNENFSIGDYIEIEDSENLLKNKRLKIVGTVNSSLYIATLRGSTNLSSGSIDYFMYMPSNNFNLKDLYTSLYVTIDKNLKRYTEEYEIELDKVLDNIKEYDDTLYLSTVLDNIGFSNFIQDTERVDNIAKIFPLIFFVVATLISLTSMTRMVEEQRVEIGTLKSLGYTGFQISMKYIIYASIATIVGGILGIIVGVNLIPRVIYMMYQMMYTTKDLIVDYNIGFSFVGLFIAYLCIISATIFAIIKELKSSPSVLMRPKSPKIGKRVFLERIPFIWNRLSFTNKVTIRNMFRYKKRFLMTIIGIAGCTSLIFAGFGLKDSVSGLLPSQYEKTFLYDIEAITTSGLKDKDIDYVKNISGIDKYQEISLEMSNVSNNDKTIEDVQMITIPINNNISEFINIVDYKNGKNLSVTSDGIIITEKLATLLDVKIGDKVEISNFDNKKVMVQVSGIAKNYLHHYMYLSDITYSNLFEIDSVNNTLLINAVDNSETGQKLVTEELLKNNNFAKVISSSTTASMMDDTMENLNYVVWVLIVSAGILAFCVLYNLANVNISERIRELATIKVLGFYDKEVHNYVEKETTILTVIGIFLGLIMGYFLSMMIIKTCELDMMKFPIDYSIDCYVYSILITIIFTFIVSIATYFNLKKINMIESLKSVE